MRKMESTFAPMKRAIVAIKEEMTMGEKRLIVADIEVENVHCHGTTGFMVITNDHGTLWYYGRYDNKEDAERAVAEYEHRFMVELHESEDKE